MEWKGAITLPSRQFVCGHCGNPLASQEGWVATLGGTRWAHIYLCHFCNKPTFFDNDGYQVPGVAYGNPVNDIPDEDVDKLYEEARNCTSSNAYTAAVLCCRKLLMNIAVAKGTKQGQSFADYVQFLSDKGFVPPDGKGWVDQIRTKGNEANHEIAIMKQEDAEDLISFIEMLLKFIYEFPAKIKRK
jgi:hypothetical protein